MLVLTSLLDQMMNEMVSMSKACKMLGVSQASLRIYGDQGKIQFVRTPGGHRRYLLSEIERLQGNVVENHVSNRAACYCRVSSNNQKQHGDLERQKLRVLEYCAQQGLKVEHVLVEVCSGMKSTRPKLNKLYDLIIKKEIDVVVIEHKDRLTRFMFDVFKAFFSSHDVQIIFVEQDLPKTFEAELVSDIMSLMTSFTATIHSRRKRQSKDYRKRTEHGDLMT